MTMPIPPSVIFEGKDSQLASAVISTRKMILGETQSVTSPFLALKSLQHGAEDATLNGHAE